MKVALLRRAHLHGIGFRLWMVPSFINSPTIQGRRLFMPVRPRANASRYDLPVDRRQARAHALALIGEAARKAAR